jgi:hypothetical protein
MNRNYKTILANILPGGDLFDGDKMIPLSDKAFRSRVVSSLKDWVDTVRPNLLKEHKPDGGSYGFVDNVFEDDDGSIFATVNITDPQTIEEFEAERYRFVSPTIAWNFRGDDWNEHDNNTWDAALLELSLVSVPRHFTRQQEILELSDLHYKGNDLSILSAELDEESDTYILLKQENKDMDFEKLTELFTGLLDDKLAPVMQRLEVIERDAAEGRDDVRKEEAETEAAEMTVVVPDGLEGEALDAIAEVVEEVVEASPEGEEEEMDSLGYYKKMAEDMKAKLEALEAESVLSEARLKELQDDIRLRDVKAKVAADVASRPHLSQMSDRLQSILLKDENLYTEVLTIAGENTRSVLAERQTVGFVPAAPKSNNVFDEALKISNAEGISYKDALAKLGV